MSKQKLNMDDLDKVSGGYLTGTVDGESLKVTGDGDAYVVTLGGDSKTFTKQQVVDFVNDLSPEPMTQEKMDQLFSYISSSQAYDIGDW